MRKENAQEAGGTNVCVPHPRAKQCVARGLAWLGFSILVLGTVAGASTVLADEAAREAVKPEVKPHLRAVSAEDVGRGGGGTREMAPTATDDAKGDEPAERFVPVLYVPPARGQARDTAAGGTRGTAHLGDVEISVLAPRDHVGFTTRAQPTLYWYVSTRVDARIDVTLVDDEAIDPLLEMTVPGPVQPGIHSLDLADHDLVLEPGKTYSWHVAVVQDSNRRGNDLLAEGFIERTGLSKDLARSLEDAANPFAPYAISGIWYDAIAELERALAADPQNRRLLLQQVALLEQAELSGVATYALRSRSW